MEQVITFAQGDGGPAQDGAGPVAQAAEGTALAEISAKLDLVLERLGAGAAAEPDE